MEYEDDECIEHINELLQELDSLYPDDSDEEEIEDINDNELSSDSQSDDEMETWINIYYVYKWSYLLFL